MPSNLPKSCVLTVYNMWLGLGQLVAFLRIKLGFAEHGGKALGYTLFVQKLYPGFYQLFFGSFPLLLQTLSTLSTYPTKITTTYIKE